LRIRDHAGGKKKKKEEKLIGWVHLLERLERETAYKRKKVDRIGGDGWGVQTGRHVLRGKMKR